MEKPLNFNANKGSGATNNNEVLNAIAARIIGLLIQKAAFDSGFNATIKAIPA